MSEFNSMQLLQLLVSRCQQIELSGNIPTLKWMQQQQLPGHKKCPPKWGLMACISWEAEHEQLKQSQKPKRRSGDASHKHIPALFKWNVQLIWINRHKSFNASHHSSNSRRHSCYLTIVSGLPTRAKWYSLRSGRLIVHIWLLLCWPVFIAEMHRRKRMRGCA